MLVGPVATRRTPPLASLRLVILLAVAAAWPTQAAAPELLVSQSRLSERGVTVAAATRTDEGFAPPAASATLTAQGGVVTALSPQAGLPRWRVTPQGGAREVILSLKAQGATVQSRLPVGPPASDVTLRMEPASPVKGRDREARLTVKLLDGAGRPWAASAPPVLRASVGSVEDVRAVGPGLFQARYVLPPTRHPEVAVLVAVAPWPHAESDTGAIGALRVALATSIDLPGRSEPGAALSMKVGGVEYGPVEVGRDGRFAIPVIVPPGEGEAISTVEDRHGNRRRERIDLRLPPVDPLACVASPPRVPADGSSRARILCGLSDARARAVGTGRITLTARHGTLTGPYPAGDGLWGWRYTAPSTPFGTDALEARVRLRGALGKESLTLTERAAPATALRVESTEPILHRGGRTTLIATATDARGRGVAGGSADTRASVGTIDAAAFDASGVARIQWRAPRVAEGELAQAQLQMSGPTGTIPARIYSWVEGDRLWLAVGDPAGLAVPDSPVRVGDTIHQTDAAGRVALPLPREPVLEVAHAEWTELKLRIHRIAGPVPAIFPELRPTRAEAVLQLPLGPELPVNVRLEVTQRAARFWAESPDGQRLTDRELSVRSSAGPLPAPRRDPDGAQVVALPDGAQLVTVSDVRSGVTAATRVAP